MLSHLLDLPKSLLPSWTHSDQDASEEAKIQSRLQALSSGKGFDPTLAHPSGIRPQIYHLHATLAAKRSLDLTSWSNAYRVGKVSFYAYNETPATGLLGRRSSASESSPTRTFVVFNCLFPPDAEPFLIKLERELDNPPFSPTNSSARTSHPDWQFPAGDHDRFTTIASEFLEQCTLIQSFAPRKNMSILDLAVVACIVNEYEPYPALSKYEKTQTVWFAFVVYRVLRLYFGALEDEPTNDSYQSPVSRKRKRLSMSGKDSLLAVLKGKQKPERLPTSASSGQSWKVNDADAGSRSDGELVRDCEELRSIFQERIREETREVRRSHPLPSCPTSS
jgi:hypothetical protein